jgi:glutaryl-CoA dehydrogenase
MKFQGVDYYQIDALLSEEEKMTRTLVREFLENEIEPLVPDAFHEEKPLGMKVLAPKLGELGMIGTLLPEEYGGSGANYVTFGLICQEVERVDSALRSFIAVQFGLVEYAIWRYGSEEQKKKWLPLIASGEKIGCFGLTEPNRGSDVAGMETVAKKTADGWVLNGTKQWISEASIADVAVVWARTDEGVKGFIVERGTEGFSQTAQKHKGSIRAGDVGELGFSDCRVPVENEMPNVKGLSSPLSCLSQARYGISWGAIGVAMDCYETALNYAKEREQFGSPIASYQLVQEKLVTMLIEITKAQLLAYRLAQLMDEGKANYTHISMAKKNNVATARMCTRLARETLGANGISLDYSPIRHMANIESVYTYEGTDDVHTLILGQSITGIPAFRRAL